MKQYWAAVPGAFGELAQGMMDGRHFHVTCPINRQVEVLVRVEPGQGLEGFARKPKALRLIEGFVKEGRELPGRISLATNSPLPVGKGLASSTAELAALGVILYSLWGLPLDREELGRRLAEVEPSDGIFYPGVVSFDHRRGECLEEWGNPPPIQILPLDWGGRVSTVAFNRRKDLEAANQAKEHSVLRAFRLLQDGFRKGDLGRIGLGATESILANQVLLSKAGLEVLAERVLAWGGLGICGAHSGTVVGILLAPGEDFTEWRQRVLAEFPERAGEWLRLYDGGLNNLTLASGGIRWEERVG